MKNQRKVKHINIGDKYGRLLVLDYIGTTGTKDKQYKTYRCKCECGKIMDAKGYLLSSKRVQSCGCLKVSKIKEIAKANIIDHTNIGLVEKKTIRSNNKSGCNGVYQNSKGSCIAMITFQGKRKYLGSFDTKKEAIHVRKEAEKVVDEILDEIKKIPTSN
ncbi:MAG: hypothetical protein RR531_04615 [Longicatena sp.]